jgi:hypothetical protein
MEYHGEEDLNTQIANHLKVIKRTTLYLIAVLLLYSLFFFVSLGRTLNFHFLLMEILIIGVMVFLLYVQIKPIARVVNSTVTEISFEDYITLKTSFFKFGFFFKREPRALKFNLDELKIKKTSYPSPTIYNLGGKVYRISDKENTVYIIAEFFDDNLEEKIQEVFY